MKSQFFTTCRIDGFFFFRGKENILITVLADKMQDKGTIFSKPKTR